MVQQTLSKVVSGHDLTREESAELMKTMMEGNVSSAQIGAALTALRMKGETVEEISGFAHAMREKVTPVRLEIPDAVDTCGTGGDGKGTFNISTAATIVAAAAGIPVAKHGNRAASGRSGSADVLETLGIDIRMDAQEAERALREWGICFMFAPLYHRAMKNVMPARKELGFRTCFNLLGPLANPAGVRRQLVGVYDPDLTETVAQVLLSLGADRVLVVAGLDGIDEVSVTGETRISEGKDGQVHTYRVTPEELGLNRCSLSELAGGDVQINAELIRDVLKGISGPKRDVVLANAGAVIYVAGRATCLQEGIHIAAETVDSGRAEKKLEKMVGAGKEVHRVS
ncbi:anthranilate phosphoribosyltransferase [Paludifilum halophilum]|uniref:Anthranilate phosphoribosyltransferase n=1 Tax=Paludifilum halophilum TaxID=1642702 RepID=A0A235BBN4_9BACL|nr:anthranilate phosphoribosyltransferase [Paludifilum halophilum]OYD09714.1 anthranilate phosphoribosyltransferase [Paludifilum halophilum]